MRTDWQKYVSLGLSQDQPDREPSTVWKSLPAAQRNCLEQLISLVKKKSSASLRSFDRFWLESFRYDQRGNRLSKETGWGAVDYQYDANNRVLRACNRSYSYDANGNLTGESGPGETVTYTYNLQQRMQSALRTSCGQTTASQYSYDALSRRSRTATGGTTDGYLYDGLSFQTVGVYSMGQIEPSPFAELQKAQRAPGVFGPGGREDLWDIGENPVEPAAIMTEEHQWIHGGSFAVRSQSNKTEYQHRDALGSIVYVSKQQGGSGRAIAYDAFGVPIRGLSLSGNDSTSSQGSDWWSQYSAAGIPRNEVDKQRYAYNGKMLDTATGMYDYGFRHYAAQIGRFTTVDSIKDGLHWYAYVNNDPVN